MNEAAVDIFMDGPVSFEFITGIIRQYSLNPHVGAYSVFMGQVRGDPVNDSRVSAIEFSSQHELASQRYEELHAFMVMKYPNLHLHIYHSLGTVRTGEVCFFVLAAGDHRREVLDACDEAVERVKSSIPIWGKLLLEDNTFQWKENT